MARGAETTRNLASRRPGPDNQGLRATGIQLEEYGSYLLGTERPTQMPPNSGESPARGDHPRATLQDCVTVPVSASGSGGQLTEFAGNCQAPQVRKATASPPPGLSLRAGRALAAGRIAGPGGAEWSFPTLGRLARFLVPPFQYPRTRLPVTRI